jgi:hypothetical protein
MNLAGKDVEIDVRDRVNAGIDLVDAPKFERRLPAKV